MSENEKIKGAKGLHPSSGVLLDSCKNEYNNVFGNAQKLDNKINIAITFCGVLFLSMIEMLDFDGMVKCPIEADESLFATICYIVLIIVGICLYLWALIEFMVLANPTDYKILDMEEILLKELDKEECQNVETYLVIKYIGANNTNSEINNKRAGKYKNGMIKLIVTVVIVIMVYIIKYNFI